MALCQFCGNQITVDNCQPDPAHWTPVCLVYQHTGRDSGRAMEAHARGLAAGLDAVYAALNAAIENTDAKLEVIEAQQMLRHRIRNPEHHRERPDWDEIDAEDRERQEVCQSCMGTGRSLTLPCPDCSEDGDAERD